MASPMALGVPYADPAMGPVVAESMSQAGALLLGRRTYEDFYSVWPKRTDSPFSAVLTNSLKYVASSTLKDGCRGRTRCCSRPTGVTPRRPWPG